MENLPTKADTLDGIEESWHPMYAKQDDGKFALRDPSALINAKNHEKIKRQEVTKEFEGVTQRLAALEKERQEEKDAILEENARKQAEKDGNFDALEQSYKDKILKQSTDFEEKQSGLMGIISDMTAKTAAQKMAGEIFGKDAEIMMPHISPRITTEIIDGKPVLKTLDAQGRPSANNLDELKSEIYNNPSFSRQVVGSNASGGGANGANSKQGSAESKTVSRQTFDGMDHTQRGAFSRSGGKVIE